MQTIENGLRLSVPGGVFYNPLMSPDRWLSARVLEVLLPKGADVLDLLCASGARGLGYARAGFDVHLNDASPTAVRAAKANARKNGLSCSFSCEEANRFIHASKRRFDAVDCDPFGSPAQFLQHMFRVVKPGGLIFLTATDLGALEGAFPETCFKRYGITSCATSFAPEMGCRNLIASAWLAGARFGRGVRPFLCYARRHYVRAFLQVSYSTKPDNIGWMSYCGKCEYRGTRKWSELPAVKCACGSALSWGGPTWTGTLGDAKIVRRLYEQTGEPMLEVFSQECGIREPYYDLHAFARARGREAESTEAAISRLRRRGCQVSRTIFSGHGVRTDAPVGKISL